ncbi:hypothetical protein N7452_001973 [Penicillium brevicompactum]|uniref:Chitin-binding type-2 domain-containing protein n=1 Tax=Penicillium brevicompactum TaxID=5074 RepID=A0A9W9R688_PENBR|nr:hypothetical protein N7452_001973 [Penicillium brevicompactum]
MAPSILSILAGLAIASSVTAFTCPEEDIAATQCQGPKDCLYPNPDNCNSFIACEISNDGTTGIPHLNDCPPNLEWNENEKICDYPEQSTCSSLNQQSSDLSNEAEPPVNGKLGENFDCAQAKTDQGCSEVECIYANPNSPNSYYQCTTETAYLVQCESDKTYQASIRACK